MKKTILLISILAIIWTLSAPVAADYIDNNISIATTIDPMPTIEYIINESSQTQLLIEGGGNAIIRPILDSGEVTAPVSVESLSGDNATIADVSIAGTNITKRIEISPESKIVISADGLDTKQVKVINNSPSVEIYHGYQQDYWTPWSEYSRIESCDEIQCRVVMANFSNKRVWIEYRPINPITMIAISDTVPGVI